MIRAAVVCVALCAACSREASVKPDPIAPPSAVPMTAIEPSAALPAPAPALSSAPIEAGVTCGVKPLRDCPLQAWMKVNTNAAMDSSDFPALAKALDATAGFAPAEYESWGSISKDGARAARASNLRGVKASCKSCHDKYKSRYKNELRTRAVPRL